MAGLTTTQTFSDGDTVTAAKLNNIIANTTIDDDAITTAKIDDDAVTLAQMDDDSVDTGQLVDLAVSNAKLAGMTRGTVKVGDSAGAASDLDAKTDNAFLTGDGTDIKSKTFDSATAGDLDITSTSANFVLKVKEPAIKNAMVYDDAINPAKISHSTSGNPGVIIYGASGVPSELTTTASTAVLTSAGSGAPTWEVGSAAKAWATVNYNEKYNNTGGTVSNTAAFNLGVPTLNTTTYEWTFVFSTALGGTAYFVGLDAYYSNASSPSADGSNFRTAFGWLTERLTTGFKVKFRVYDGSPLAFPYRINVTVFG